MKFWQKIFFGSLIIFIIMISMAGTVLLRTWHTLEVTRETERGLSEHYAMGTALGANIKYAASRMDGMESFPRSALSRTIQDYVTYYGPNNVSIQVYDEKDRLVFNNYTEKLPDNREELKNIPSGRRLYLIRDTGTETDLFISGCLQVEGVKLTFVYIRNISPLYSAYNSQIRFFIWLDIGVSFVTALSMLLFALFSTRPVKLLNQSALVIANGNFSERVKISAKDELGELSRNFNKMAGIVEEKILELERTASEREQFVHFLTHELKTPLTAMIGYANLLRTADCSREQREKALEYLYDSSRRLESISFKLMDLLYLNRNTPEFKPCETEEIIKSAAKAVQSGLEKRKITLLTECCTGKLNCDKDLFVTMLVNLIDNAAKASKDGTAIRLCAVREADAWRISVTDYGRGMAKEELEKITLPYYSKGGRVQKSIGLGLTLCEQIAALHGAKLDFVSEKGKGTTVSIRICYN